jgi:hypothetical protein
MALFIQTKENRATEMTGATIIPKKKLSVDSTDFTPPKHKQLGSEHHTIASLSTSMFSINLT